MCKSNGLSQEWEKNDLLKPLGRLESGERLNEEQVVCMSLRKQLLNTLQLYVSKIRFPFSELLLLLVPFRLSTFKVRSIVLPLQCCISLSRT